MVRDSRLVQLQKVAPTEGGTHTIDTGAHPPVKQPMRRTPFALRSKVVQEMLSQGVIELG